jgi:hypothetical protein
LVGYNIIIEEAQEEDPDLDEDLEEGGDLGHATSAHHAAINLLCKGLLEALSSFASRVDTQVRAQFGELTANHTITVVVELGQSSSQEVTGLCQEMDIFQDQLSMFAKEADTVPSNGLGRSATSLLSSLAPCDMSATLNGDISFCIMSIGCSEFMMTMNHLFSMVRYLVQARVDVFTEQSKNSGVIFNQRGGGEQV